MVELNKIITLVLMAMLIALASSRAFAAGDYAREKRWADEVTPGIVVGEPVYLTQKNKHKFLAIRTDAEQPKMGVVVVHGMGIHPDWGMVNILRERLADEGYTTLSIQMPVLASDASFKAYPGVFPEAGERLQLAIEYLKQQGYQRIAIASHSMGTRMSRAYLKQRSNDVSAWASLSMTQQETYEGIHIPVFDLYGSNDLPHVLSATKQRKLSLQKNPYSKQTVIADANHFFAGKEEEMVMAVKQFFDSFDQ